MANCADTMANSMKPANAKAVVHGVLSQAQIDQLPPRDDTVLPLGQASDCRVQAQQPTLASPPQPAYIAG
jgi:hypothetical protein